MATNWNNAHKNKIKAQLYKRQRARCYECKLTFKKEDLTLHHLTHRAEGGPNTAYNLRLVCSPCHRAIHEVVSK